MSRYMNPPVDAVLAAVPKWQQRCVVDGLCLFVDEPVWTPAAFDDLMHHFIDAPNDGDGNFLSKLSTQLKDATPAANWLAVDLAWLLYLFPRGSIGAAKKVENLSKIASFGGHSLPKDHWALNPSVLQGIGGTGTFFNTGFWLEYSYAMLVLHQLASLSVAQRAELVNPDADLMAWLDGLSLPAKLPAGMPLSPSARMFRHMWLYLMQPDRFERIASSGNKRQIVKQLAPQLGLPVDLSTARHIDETLLGIRRKLESKHGTTELDFYEPPLHELWVDPAALADQPATAQAVTANEPDPGPYAGSADLPDAKSSAGVNSPTAPHNLILYGPPGTGKTYTTVDAALKLIDPSFADNHATDRSTLKRRFDELVKAGRIRFVTFHQSLSYEDFVEGLRAVHEPEGEGGPATLSYRVEPGVFRQLCEAAMRDEQVDEDLGVREGARLWKLSLDGTGPSPTRDYCYAHGEARVGWGHVGDLEHADLTQAEFKLGSNDRHSLNCFAAEVEPGDVILSIRSNREVGAVGVVTGPYRYEAKPPVPVDQDYRHVLPVRWLASGLSLDLRELNEGKLFTLKTFYPLLRLSWPKVASALEQHKPGAVAMRKRYRSAALPHVLVIDEINRGNVSRIFGELLTLIEASKRAGQPEALEVTLPYSRQRFSVPANVHLIGTMNTADRSLAGLDIALRRRFTFKEMPPRPELLDGVNVEGVNLGALLRVMNERIELLLDRDHLLGHAYLLPLASEGEATLPRLADVFRHQVVPLLQEYFFEDWERIGWVLNDPAKAAEHRFVLQGGARTATALFGAKVAEQVSDRRWRLNDVAFDRIESYRGILFAANPA